LIYLTPKAQISQKQSLVLPQEPSKYNQLISCKNYHYSPFRGFRGFRVTLIDLSHTENTDITEISFIDFHSTKQFFRDFRGFRVTLID